MASKLGGATVITGKGKGKDQYGRKFGKKHNEAMFEFTKTMWLQDAVQSLKNLIQIEAAKNAFMAFLKTEYGEAQLEFVLDIQKLDTMDPQAQAQAAVQIYQQFMSAGGKGIGQQERTSATQQMWDGLNQGGGMMMVDPMTALYKLREEAEATLKMLSFDAFPRFVKTPQCLDMMSKLKGTGNTQIEGMINAVGGKAPQDADDWLNTVSYTHLTLPTIYSV